MLFGRARWPADSEQTACPVLRARTSTLRALTATTVVAAGIIAAIPVAAQAAAVSVPCSETALVGAINTANAQPGSDTLNLAAGCTYRLTRSNGNAGNGPVGLPVITSTIALVGTPNIITRSGLALFRIAEVRARATSRSRGSPWTGATRWAPAAAS